MCQKGHRHPEEPRGGGAIEKDERIGEEITFGHGHIVPPIPDSGGGIRYLRNRSTHDHFLNNLLIIIYIISTTGRRRRCKTAPPEGLDARLPQIPFKNWFGLIRGKATA